MRINLNIIGTGCTCDLCSDLDAIKTLLDSPSIKQIKEPQTMCIKGAALLTVIKVYPDEDKDNIPQG